MTADIILPGNGQTARDRAVYQHIWECEQERPPADTFRLMIDRLVDEDDRNRIRVADLGSGSGRHARWAVSLGCYVEAVEYDRTGAERQRRHPAFDYILKETDARLWLDDQVRSGWDALVCFDALHHMVGDLDALGLLLSRICYVVRPGGFLLLTLLCDIQYSVGVLPTNRLDVSADTAEAFLRRHFSHDELLVVKRKAVDVPDTVTIDKQGALVHAHYHAQRVLVLVRRAVEA